MQIGLVASYVQTALDLEAGEDHGAPVALDPREVECPCHRHRHHPFLPDLQNLLGLCVHAHLHTAKDQVSKANLYKIIRPPTY